MRVYFAFVVATLAIVASSSSQAAVRLSVKARPSSSDWPGRRESCIGILGEVARPGVYRFGSSCTLSDLIGRSGGLSDSAAGTVRFFRKGRLAQQALVAAAMESPLSAGDLAVIDARSFSPTRLAQIHSHGAVDGTRRAAEVQLAFLNLLDRPVIVKVRRQNSTLARLIALLGQSENIASGIRVVSPAARGQVDRSGRRLLTELESGSVLIFPPGKLTHLLPWLPEPYDEAAPVSQSAKASQSEAMRDAAEDPGATGRIRLASSSIVIEPPAPATASSLPVAAALPCPLNALRVESDGAFRNPASKAPCQPPISTGFVASKSQHLHAGMSTLSENWASLLAAGMGFIALFVMAVTLGTMAHRWIASARLRKRAGIAAVLVPAGGFASTALPAAAPPRALQPDKLSVRIDASRPITRLSVDLKVLEMHLASANGRSKGSPGDSAAGYLSLV